MQTLTRSFRTHFLFQTRCEGRHRRQFWAWNLFFLTASAVGTGLLSLLLALARYRWGIFFGYFRHPLIALLNILPVVLLILLLYCLVNRPWIAFLAGSVPVMLASVGNYFKLLCRDDPFMFADVWDIPTALRFSGRYDLSLNWRLGFCLACLVLGTLFLFFFVRGRARPRPRITLAAVILLSILPLSRVYASDTVYDKMTQNYEYANQWSATQNYISHGFLYPFLHSITEMV